MANNVIAQVIGGTKKVLDKVEDVSDVKRELGASGYTANVNGDPVDDDYVLDDQDFVSLAKPAKGGA